MYMKQINGGDRILSSTLIKMSLYSLHLKINNTNMILSTPKESGHLDLKFIFFF